MTTMRVVCVFVCICEGGEGGGGEGGGDMGIALESFPIGVYIIFYIMVALSGKYIYLFTYVKAEIKTLI